ncbi:transcriptional regulator, XRE family with cupin sensor [Pedococcus cremeus]|uniref:Transcriptional regulator, XRE family with cupin sensor n=2 Tax=Pedococcus cremeus TaxID=587636 RepID=A0A1H9WEA3_9MICO|nr:transcriptional regulator, XRE family with cupin sensor [Pedococcus cremeus]
MSTVGAQLKTLRKMRTFTIEALSARSGVSIGLISQIERGRGNPSFNTLVQMAHALDVPIGRLFHAADDTSPLVRSTERRSLDVHGPSGDASHELMSPDLNGALEAVWIEAPPGYDTSATPFTHPGEEFGVVLEGRHEVYLDGVRYELGPGDSITYPSTTPHWYRNAGTETVKAIWVITPPTF